MTRLLTTSEAAALLGVSAKWTRYLVRTGQLRAQRLSAGAKARIRIPENAIDEFLARHNRRGLRRVS